MSGLHSLPSSFSPSNSKPWLDFFTAFGTHVTTQVIMGGQAYQVVGLASIDAKTLAWEEIIIREQIRIFFGIFTHTTTHIEKKELNANFTADVQKYAEGCEGGDASICSAANFSYGDWAETVAGAPLPVGYQLTAIDDYLLTRGIIDEQMSDAFQNATLWYYLNYGSLCSAYVADSSSPALSGFEMPQKVNHNLGTIPTLIQFSFAPVSPCSVQNQECVAYVVDTMTVQNATTVYPGNPVNNTVIVTNSFVQFDTMYVYVPPNKYVPEYNRPLFRTWSPSYGKAMEYDFGYWQVQFSNAAPSFDSGWVYDTSVQNPHIVAFDTSSMFATDYLKFISIWFSEDPDEPQTIYPVLGGAVTNPIAIYFSYGQLFLDISPSLPLFGTPNGLAKKGYWRGMVFDPPTHNISSTFYDSGWIQCVKCTNVLAEHNFGVTPALVQVFFTATPQPEKDVENPLIWPYMRWHAGAPHLGPQSIELTHTEVNIQIQIDPNDSEQRIISAWEPFAVTGQPGRWGNYTQGHFRVIALSETYLLNSTFAHAVFEDLV